ncbi:MAG: NADH-quinone oxidoreductase subunit J [Ignavibacteriales bacterium]|nr:NADH-quinone oxidoreductase subunit J [Ignavibacteriales bacterium]
MDMYAVMFYFFAVVTIASAFAVVSTKNIIYSAFNLMLTFFGVAGIYVLLGADFIAIVQLIVYVGGILILLIFGVMLTNKITDSEIKTGWTQVLPAMLVVAAFAGTLLGMVLKSNWRVLPQLQQPVTGLADIGVLLVNEYALIFELLGALLLIALIGAASIARK